MREIAIAKAPISDKRAAILETTLDLISERGFHNTPMSMVTRESGVSTGTIYHYFASKDELIFELYKEIKLEMFQSTMRGFSEQQSYREGFLGLWYNFLEYYIQHPQETAFLEQFENSPYSKSFPQGEFAKEMAPFLNFVGRGVQEGVLKDLPIQVGAELTFGVAFSLAKQHIAGAIVLDEELIEATANACWDAIAR